MAARVRLSAVLGDHPHVKAIKSGAIGSDLVDLEFIPFSPSNTAFKPMVREQKFDVCEMAVVTYLMAKAWKKPLALLPAAMLGRFQRKAQAGDAGADDDEVEPGHRSQRLSIRRVLPKKTARAMTVPERTSRTGRKVSASEISA